MLEKFFNVFVTVIFLLLMVLIINVLTACGTVAEARASKPPVAEETIKPTPSPSPVKENAAGAALDVYAWNTKPGRDVWSKVLKKSIDANWQELKKAQDTSEFCSNWASLNEETQKKVFAELFVAIAYFESAWDPLSRMQETTMGVDPTTGKPVFSEGLFQLSYQDEQWIKCGFYWFKDKDLNPESPQKTILNPELNIDCAVRIMARQIKNKGEILLRSGVYWAVIKEGGKYEKISAIKKRVKDNVSSCK